MIVADEGQRHTLEGINDETSSADLEGEKCSGKEGGVKWGRGTARALPALRQAANQVQFAHASCMYSTVLLALQTLI